MVRRALVLKLVALSVTAVSGIAEAQERPRELSDLVSRLSVSGRGVTTWLERLGVNSAEPATERLLVVRATGERLTLRDGRTSSVELDGDLDGLLRTPGTSAVLVHNHPSSVGLSAADIGQVSKPGVAAIIAIGHDGSVFIASAGRNMDRDFLEARQYVHALNEVTRRLRAEWPSRAVPVSVSDAQLNHLVARTLSQAGIIQYWSDLRGDTRASYDFSQMTFNRVVAGAAAYLRRVEKPALSARR
jgi:hypothetical protein